jgi:IclR family acetate operon transcriptional repressor
VAIDVKTAGRTVDIFETFARTKAPMSLTELARALGAPNSSCYNLIAALEARGYLYSVGTRRRIYPTRRLFEVASLIIAGEPWLERIEPMLLSLRDTCEETIILGKRQGSQIVYLAVHEGFSSIRYTARAGDVKPLHSSSIGKALLASMPLKERKALVGKLKLQQITPWTIVDADVLLAELDRTARRGWASTRGENVVDVMAVAAPVRLGTETCAIAIAGPVQRMEPKMQKHVEALLGTCAEILKIHAGREIA